MSTDETPSTEPDEAADLGPSTGDPQPPVKDPSAGEELEFVLGSIADLEAEFEAGDLDEAEYASLRSEYEAEAARLLRDPKPQVVQRRSKPAKRRALLLWVGSAALLAIVGMTFARYSGARNPGGSLIAASDVGSRLDECASMGPMNPAGSECYDKVLKDFPNQPEALTYSGWALVRAEDVDAGVNRLNQAVKADPTYPDPHVFLAVAASRAEDFDTANAELDQVFTLKPSQDLVSTLQQMGLEQKVAEGALSPELGACWSQAKAAFGVVETSTDTAASSTTTTVFQPKVEDITGAFRCFDDRIASLSGPAQAGDEGAVNEIVLTRTLLGWLTFQLDRRLAEDGLKQLDAALALAPDDPTALMVRGFMYGSLERWDEARADAEKVDSSGRRPNGIVTGTLGYPADLVAAIDEASATATTPSSTAAGPSTSAAPVTSR